MALDEKRKRHDRGKHAYQPKPPFRIIEGVGEEKDTSKTLDPFGRLSPSAVWVLARFYSKFTGRNRADLSLTYAEVETVMSNAIFVRAVWELVGFGFIDIKRFGRLERNASVYALGDRWRSLGDPKKCADIEALLEEIKNLQGERAVVGKRGRLCALRNRLLTGAGK